MPKSISFKKQLCGICHQSFSPLRLKKKRGMAICPACLKLVMEREYEWRDMADRPQEIQSHNEDRVEESNLIMLIRQKGHAFLDDAKAISRTFTLGLSGVIMTRLGVYLGGSSLLGSQSPWLAMLNGVMMADLVTWVLFNILQLPFVGTGFLLEFIIYGGMLGLLINADKALFSFPQEGESLAIAFLVFLGVGVIKTTLWCYKIFIVGDR